MPTILIAEDEGAIAETVLYALRAEGWQAEHVLLGGDVLPRVRRGGIDLLILDVGLPDASGFEVCRALRAESNVPVIFLTARDGEVDRVLGLELGADDYIAKPFSQRLLIARIRAILRRAEPLAAGTAPEGAPVGIGVAAFFCFMFSWVELLLARTLTSVDARPIVVAMTRTASASGLDWGLLAAAGVLTILPGALVIWFVRNYIAKGFALGRV